MRTILGLRDAQWLVVVTSGSINLESVHTLMFWRERNIDHRQQGFPFLLVISI